MSSSRTLDEFCEFLGQADPDQGDEAARRFRSWCSGQVPYAYPAVLGRHMRRDQLDLVFDAFREVLPFGTGGRRGRVGYGPNRINLTTIAMTVQGHCEHLRAAFPDRETLTVVVANDVRVFNDLAGTYTFLGDDHPLLGLSSRSLARFVCEVYAGNGVRVYFPDPEVEDAVLTTPELSFLIRELGAAGGVNLSASHNPPDDNGIKLYDHHGGQPVAPDDQRLIDRMEQVERIRSRPFDESRASGLIREIPENLHQEYVRLYVGQAVILDKPRQDIPITYTPLCGCGMTTVGEVLTELGFPLLVPPDQRRLDGTFAAIPLRAPNPEVPQATLPAREFAGENGSSIVLSSDPDADRVGVEARLEDGSWYHFDGNQIAAILGYYLMLDPHGPRRRGLVIQTLVTTKILGKIARTAGECLLIDDLLVGFKYVADILKTLEFEGRFREIASSPERLVLAVEESHGVMLVPDIRDKDATPACMIFAALHQRLHGEGRTLLDYYTQILEELGGFDSISRSITMTGAEGIRRKRKIMSSLRRSPPAVLLDRKVTRIVDYLDEEAFGPLVSESDKLPRDVFQIFTDSFIVTVRPSGTEPKLKLYCQLLPGDADPAACGSELLRQTRACTEAASRRVYNELLARIELCLDEAALLLPDIVELDQKQCFEQRTVPELRDSISDGSFRNLEALHDWLRRKTENMTPGGDPLPALKKAVAHLCGLWSRDLGSRPLLDQLKAWAES